MAEKLKGERLIVFLLETPDSSVRVSYYASEERYREIAKHFLDKNTRAVYYDLLDKERAPSVVAIDYTKVIAIL